MNKIRPRLVRGNRSTENETELFWPYYENKRIARDGNNARKNRRRRRGQARRSLLDDPP